MSFFNSNQRAERMPGQVMGNPMTGLCERVCIAAKKVFDACLRQETLERENISVRVMPSGRGEGDVALNPAQPFKFISASCASSSGVISDLVVEPVGDGRGCSRCKFNVTVPLRVVLSDEENERFLGVSEITVPLDILLFIPEQAVIPWELECAVSCVVPDGVYVGGDEFSITACTTIISKIIMEVELLIPAYGYSYIPPCHEFTDDACAGAFDLPLYPPNVRR